MAWAAAFKALGTIFSAALPFLKQRFAERSAGKAPWEVAPSVTDAIIDAALLRLGELKTDEPLWKRCVISLEGAFVRPDLFKMPTLREWLSRPHVREGIKHAAEAAIARSVVPEQVVTLLADEYSDSTGEDRRFADYAIRMAVAFIQASVQGAVKDLGTAALVQATSSNLVRHVDSKMAELAKGSALSGNLFISARSTQDGGDELDRVLRRRATPGQNTREDLQKLIRDFELGGRFAAAAQLLQDDAACWLARVEATSGNVAAAERRLTELERRGYKVPTAAWALVDFGKSDFPTALQRVRQRSDPESQSVVFITVLTQQGQTAALQYVDDLGQLTPNAFTALGWNNVYAALVNEGRTADAAAMLARLPEDVLSQCTMLYYRYAVSQVLPMLPIERHSDILKVGFGALDEHILDSPESSAAKTRALAAAEQAQQCAANAEDHALEEECANGIRLLRLLDERTRDGEIKSILGAMKDGEAALRLIAVARACNIEFDAQPLEQYLDRAQRLGGLNEQQRRAKFHLLDTPDRSAEFVRFLEEEWINLLKDTSAEHLVVLKVQALARIPDFDGATAFLALRADEVGESVLARLGLMLRDARGEDPSDATVELFRQTNAIGDLRNLVLVLKSRNRWKTLAPYAATLFNREPNFDNAMLCLHCLRQTQADAKTISAFLEETAKLVEQRPEIQSARAWAWFEVGNHMEAKRLNDELLAHRDQAHDLALDVNIAIRTGDWERFASIAARGWERRAQLNGRMLLTLARIVGFSDPAQSLILAQEAVARESSDPAILLGANAIGIAARREDLAMPWVHKAAELSKDGGPVSIFSYREVVEFMRSNAESWRHKNELYRTGQIPLHMAASIFNASFSQLLIATPRQNAREVDPRRWQPVPIRSGQRVPAAPHQYSRVALDVTALFVLGELNLLGAVFELLDEVYVSPRLMDALLEDRAQVAFHQPSRVAEVKPLNGWVASGRLRVVDVKADAELVKEIGYEAAALLKEAETSGGMFVHPGALFKVTSNMEEEVALGPLQPRLADPVDVLNALRKEGVITQADGIKAHAVMQDIGLTGRQDVPPAVPLYLDRLAIEYLSRAKLLQPLLNSAHSVSVHKTTFDEWQALLATEPMTEDLVDAIDAIRRTVRAALMLGKVKFLATSRKRDDSLNVTTMLPIFDLLEDLTELDAVVVDDRMIGSGTQFADTKGKSVPLLSSLDLMGMLVDKGVLSADARRESLHILRARCFFCVPIDMDDVSFYLGHAAVQDGQLKETAELRTIRQYLARLNSTDVLCTASDLSYQDSLWRVATLVIGKLWMDEALPVAEASAKSDWVVAHLLPDLEVAMRFAPDAPARIAEVAAAKLGASLILPLGNATRRDAYARWITRARLSPMLPANSHILDLAAEQVAQSMIRRTSEAANELRSRISSDPTQ